MGSDGCIPEYCLLIYFKLELYLIFSNTDNSKNVFYKALHFGNMRYQ